LKEILIIRTEQWGGVSRVLIGTGDYFRKKTRGFVRDLIKDFMLIKNRITDKNINRKKDLEKENTGKGKKGPK